MSTGPAPSITGFDPIRLVENHQAGIWRYLRALGCDPTLAEDLAQDTFLAVLQKPFQDYNAAATAAYLRRVAFNLFISNQRRSGKITTVENIEELDVRFAALAGDDGGEAAIDALRTCLEHLGERARWALEMRFRDDLPRNVIANALEITEHGAKNLMQRAKQQLRTCIENKIK